jgi:transcriptional regulator with XRE-family HTH domain
MLRELRAAKGMTQEDLAKKSKVTRPYIAKIETGGKTNPSIAVLRRLAKALGVPVAELLSWIEGHMNESAIPHYEPPPGTPDIVTVEATCWAQFVRPWEDSNDGMERLLSFSQGERRRLPRALAELGIKATDGRLRIVKD